MKRALAMAAIAIGLATTSGGTSRGALAPAMRAIDDAITTMDLDRAHALLDGADASDPRVALEKGRLALFELKCDDALALLARPELAHVEPAVDLADVARGCARATAATIVDRDDAAGIEVRWQDEHDRALLPLLAETATKAKEALARDLGATWPKPTRIVVVRDLLSLSAMTGLEYKDAETTGTVAIAKWGRVTILSPRASHHGFAWRDTLTHELTHLAVTRLTSDRAPLWLQEGVAKREEVRWRPPGPFDFRPQPESVVAKGMEKGMTLPLDKLGRSIAMLPSADQAAVAFAEVTSFLRYFADNAGDQALPKLLRAVEDKDDVNAALVAVTGADFTAWDKKWRDWMAALPKEPLPATWGLGAPPAGIREMRERARLAELLVGREHPKDALTELDALKSEAWSDASLRYLRARAMEASGSAPDATIESLGEPKDVASSFGPWWAIRGRLARAKGDGPGAPTSEGFFAEAIAADPFDVECACQSLDPASSPADPAISGLCAAARARAEPDVGKD